MQIVHIIWLGFFIHALITSPIDGSGFRDDQKFERTDD